MKIHHRYRWTGTQKYTQGSALSVASGPHMNLRKHPQRQGETTRLCYFVLLFLLTTVPGPLIVSFNILPVFTVSLYDCGIVVLEIMTHLSLIPIPISFFFLLTAMKFCELCFQTTPRVPSLVTISAAIILVQNHFLSELLQ